MSTTTATTTTSGTLRLFVYFLRHGKIAAVRRTVQATQQVGGAALNQLIQGPDQKERAAGLTTAMTNPYSFQLAIANGVATLRPTRSLPNAFKAQVVYTLTQFPTVRSVQMGRLKYTRASFESLTPAIFIESPAVGDTVSSPLAVSGTANTFEGRFQLELRAGGRRRAKQSVQARSGTGTRGAFTASIPFHVTKLMPGVLLAYQLSPKNGQPIDAVRIPLKLEPS